MTSKWSGRSVEELMTAFIALGEEYPWPLTHENVQIYDRVVREVVEVADALKATGDVGRAALLSLMNHVHLPVRLQAAKACLSFAKDQAVEVLIDITEMNAGNVSMDAQLVLMFADEFDMATGPKRRPNPLPPLPVPKQR